MNKQMILIGHANNKRTEGMQQARKALGLPPAVVLSYTDLLSGRCTLEQAAAMLKEEQPPLLRLDAPGEEFEVERSLIALGAQDGEVQGEYADRLLPFGSRPDPQPMSVRAAQALEEQTGRLYHPSQWYRGFGRLLGKLELEAAGLWKQPGWLNAPSDIAAMFDKRCTQLRLQKAGIPVPAFLTEPDTILDYEALREAMNERRMFRLFIKLATGSGACGVLAYQVHPHTGAELAITTLGIETYNARPPMLYNSIKLRRYSDTTSIRLLVNWLLLHGAQVEQWVAKAAIGDRSFDVRQLVVDGKACHHVVRANRSPITNLHLRSERMSASEAGLSSETQNAVQIIAERALSQFPQSRVAGIDVLLRSGTYAPCIVDINPFGDLLYRVTHHGDDPYTWELRQWTK